MPVNERDLELCFEYHAEKFKDQMHQQRGGFGPQEKPKKEGEVHLKSKKSSKEKINTESLGDYVDYEEVE